jgi:hypothetical protein
MTPCHWHHAAFSGPTATQYGLGVTTLALGAFGAWLQWKAGALSAKAVAIHPIYPLGAPPAEVDIAKARAAGEKRRLLEHAAVLNSASTAALLFAVVSGLTINFPIFWLAGCGAAIAAVVWGIATWSKLPKLDRRIETFLTLQEIIARMRGFIFSVERDKTLNAAFAASDAELDRAIQRLEAMKREHDAGSERPHRQEAGREEEHAVKQDEKKSPDDPKEPE